MKFSVYYDEDVVKELVEKDRLLQFRLKLILTKEKRTEKDAYISIFKNEISSDVFRMNKYVELLHKS